MFWSVSARSNGAMTRLQPAENPDAVIGCRLGRSPCAAPTTSGLRCSRSSWPERRVSADHPLRRIKAMDDEVLGGISATFDAMCRLARPSMQPERLLKSQILMALYSVGSDRQFREPARFQPAVPPVLEMNGDAPTFDASSFSRIGTGRGSAAGDEPPCFARRCWTYVLTAFHTGPLEAV